MRVLRISEGWYFFLAKLVIKSTGAYSFTFKKKKKSFQKPLKFVFCHNWTQSEFSHFLVQTCCSISSVILEIFPKILCSYFMILYIWQCSFKTCAWCDVQQYSFWLQCFDFLGFMWICWSTFILPWFLITLFYVLKINL